MKGIVNGTEHNIITSHILVQLDNVGHVKSMADM